MAALQTAKDPKTDVTKTEVETTNEPVTIPEARQEFLRQIQSLAASARTAIPGTNDTLEKRANEIVTNATTLASNGAASLADAKNFLAQAEVLQRDTQLALATRRNPWSIQTAAAQESSRFNQVVTLSVPSGQAIDVHYNRATTNSCVEKGHQRLCPGSHGPIKSPAGELWRQPDPNKRGFDIITVATFERHCEPTRCGGIQRDAFRGYITVKDPCASEGFHVNINNGAKNTHLTSESGISALNVSANDLVAPNTLYEMDPEPLSPSASEYFPTGSDTVETQELNVEKQELEKQERKQEPLPSQFSVATEKSPLKVVLKPGESLFVYKDSTLEGAIAPIEGALEHTPTIGANAGVARLTETLPGGEKVYEVRPNASPPSEPFKFKIIRWGDEGLETLAESDVYLGTSSSTPDVSRASTKLESGQPIASKLDVVLPLSGSYASVSKPLTIELGMGPLQVLNMYEQGGSHLGSVRSDSPPNSWRSADGAIRLERDTSPGAPELRFHLFADPSLKDTRSINVSVFSPSAPRATERTSITVGPDQADQLRKPEVDEERMTLQEELQEELKLVEATRTAGPKSDQKQEPSLPATAEPLIAEQKKPYTVTVRPGESLFVDYERRDQEGKILGALEGEYEMAGNTVGASIPGVGKFSRTRNPNGEDVITLTPDKGFHGEISTRRRTERVARTVF